MSYNTERKPRQCHQQAIFTLQKIFPEANLSQLSKNSSVWEMLEKSAKNLPRPGLGDITSTITNMKSVIDNQQLKIQKNMIEIERQQEMIMSTQKQQQEQYQNQKQARLSKYYQQSDNPTATRLFFSTNQNTFTINDNQQQSSSQYPQQSSYQINNQNRQEMQQEEYEKIEIQQKERFFGDDQIDYFTPCNNNIGESFIGVDDDDDCDVKKYLVFDF